MKILIQFLHRFKFVLNFFSWAPPLLARFTVGWVFIESGWGKLQHLDKVTAFFTDLGLPIPAFQAYLVATTELTGGILLLLGVLSRITSVPLIIIMTVAIATAKRSDLHGFSDLAGFSEFLYIILLFWIIVQGPGPLALDKLISHKLKKMD
jgi:putative oxidoreductase